MSIADRIRFFLIYWLERLVWWLDNHRREQFLSRTFRMERSRTEEMKRLSAELERRIAIYDKLLLAVKPDAEALLESIKKAKGETK